MYGPILNVDPSVEIKKREEEESKGSTVLSLDGSLKTCSLEGLGCSRAGCEIGSENDEFFQREIGH